MLSVVTAAAIGRSCLAGNKVDVESGSGSGSSSGGGSGSSSRRELSDNRTTHSCGNRSNPCIVLTIKGQHFVYLYINIVSFVLLHVNSKSPGASADRS